MFIGRRKSHLKLSFIETENEINVREQIKYLIYTHLNSPTTLHRVIETHLDIIGSLFSSEGSIKKGDLKLLS